MARDVAVDAQGNIYVVGSTYSPDFPTTAGVLGPSFGGTSDAFIVKLSPSGTVLWSTFLGGPNYERAYAVEVDGSGNVVVAGRAGAGFPVTTGAFQTAFQGGVLPTDAYGPQDGFVCKIRPDGTAIIFCSYFGTSDPWIVRDVAVDAGRQHLCAPALTTRVIFRRHGLSAHIRRRPTPAGMGSWPRSPQTAPACSGQPISGAEATRVQHHPLASMPVGDVYYLTSTDSPDMPTPAGFDKSLGGAEDLYLARFSTTGQSLRYGTYIGGSGNESLETHSLAVNAAGERIRQFRDKLHLTSRRRPAPFRPRELEEAKASSRGSRLADRWARARISVAVAMRLTQGIAIRPDGSISVGGPPPPPISRTRPGRDCPRRAGGLSWFCCLRTSARNCGSAPRWAAADSTPAADWLPARTGFCTRSVTRTRPTGPG